MEGSTDRAFLTGLRDRWCPQVQLIEGRFRGRSGQSQRREIPKVCAELNSKGVDLIIFMRDANNENWRDVLKADVDKCVPQYRHIVAFAVCDRNIESWLCADRDWIARWTDRAPADFAVDDPKGVFQSALKITAWDRKEEEIAYLIGKAPLHRWLFNKSFEAFYNELWLKSKTVACTIENLRDRRQQRNE